MTFRQQAQHGDVILDGDVVQVAFAEGGDRHRAGVMTVRLVGLFVVQDPHPGRQLRWHIDHALTNGDQLLGKQRPGPGAPSIAHRAA